MSLVPGEVIGEFPGLHVKLAVLEQYFGLVAVLVFRRQRKLDLAGGIGVNITGYQI